MSAAVSPEVEILTADVGIWRGTVEVRPTPDGPVQASEGILTSRMCGPWLVSDFKNETSGFEGHGVYGWDSVGGHYVGTWVDPMRRSLVVMRGEWDEAAHTMTFVGEMTRSGGSSMRWREVTERPEDELRVFRSFVPSPQGEIEVMTVHYRKLK
jgi:hypothetical protein